MNWFLHWVITSACLLATAYLVPGFTITNMFSAFLTSAALGLLNIIIWPLLAILTLPLTILTFGLFLFVVNAMVLKFGAALVPGFYIEGFMPKY